MTSQTPQDPNPVTPITPRIVDLAKKLRQLKNHFTKPANQEALQEAAIRLESQDVTITEMREADERNRADFAALQRLYLTRGETIEQLKNELLERGKHINALHEELSKAMNTPTGWVPQPTPTDPMSPRSVALDRVRTIASWGIVGDIPQSLALETIAELVKRS